jgi:hypothetical protein
MPVNILGCTKTDHLLVRNNRTGDLIECKVDTVGKKFLYVFLGTENVRFLRRTGAGDDNDYEVLACGAQRIEEMRKQSYLDSIDSESERSRLEIPKQTDTEEGSLNQVAELLARRIAFHWSNKDFDGAIRILQAAKAEYVTREHDLVQAAKCNGLSAPLNLLGLSVRITNSLERSGCQTIFDLCVKDGGSLMLSAGLGPVSYEVVRKKLEEYGFDHRMEPLQLRKQAA